MYFLVQAMLKAFFLISICQEMSLLLSVLCYTRDWGEYEITVIIGS